MVQSWSANAKLPPTLQKILDEGRNQGHDQGLSEGLSRGLAKAKAADVLTVLEAREIAVSAEIREKVLACTDLATLDRWIRRAATLKTAAAVVREPAKKLRASPR